MKGHVKDNCFKYKEYLKPKTTIAKANVNSSEIGDVSAASSHRFTNEGSMSNFLQGGTTFTSE